MKKGELTLKGIVELVVSAAVVSLLLWVAFGFGTDTFYLQARLARDGAAFVNAFQAVPGNAWVRYEPNLTHYTFQLQSDQALVEDKIPSFQKFYGNVVPVRISDAKALYFFKDGPTISVGDKEPLLKKFECADFTYHPSNVKMRVTEETKQIAIYLKLRCSETNLCAQDQESLDSPADMFIKIVPMAHEGIAVRYPRASLDSRKIACALANKLTVSSVWLLPTNDAEISPRGMLVEIGGEHSDLIAQSLEAVLK